MSGLRELWGAGGFRRRLDPTWKIAHFLWHMYIHLTIYLHLHISVSIIVLFTIFTPSWPSCRSSTIKVKAVLWTSFGAALFKITKGQESKACQIKRWIKGQSGRKCVIVASAMRAEQGPVSRSRAVYAKLESNSEPERARVCQRVAVRASESQSGSHREP